MVNNYNEIVKLANDFYDLVAELWHKFTELVKPIIEAYEKYKSLRFTTKRKFMPIRKIKHNKLNFTNKPRLIRCRNNC